MERVEPGRMDKDEQIKERCFMAQLQIVFVHPAWFDAFHNRLPLVFSDASMTRKRQENVKSSVKNGKPFHSRAKCCQSKRFREAVVVI